MRRAGVVLGVLGITVLLLLLSEPTKARHRPEGREVPDDAPRPQRVEVAAPVRGPIEAPPAIELPGHLDLEGTVFDEEGRPLEGATVYARTRPDSAWTETVAGGAFLFQGLREGRYALTARSPLHHLTFESDPPVYAEAGDTGVRVVCRRPSQVTIRVLDAATGKPVQEEIALWLSFPAGSLTGMATGGVEVTHRLPPGRATLRVHAAGYHTLEDLAIDVPSGADAFTVDVELSSDPGVFGTVDLVVADETGAPVTDLVWRHSRLQSPDGRYSLRLVAGTHRVRLESPLEQPAWLPADVEITIVRGGHLTREVRMRRGGCIRAYCEPAGAFTDFAVEGAQGFRALVDGFVALVPPGTHEVTAKHRDVLHRLIVEVGPHQVAEAPFTAPRSGR